MSVTEPMYFDDFPVGWTYRTEPREVPLEAITEFARQWDPQPFHIDPEGARASPYGGIIASGWHTLILAFLMWYQTGLWAEASMGSPGMDNIRWLKPVRPGDRLHVRLEVLESNPSKSRPGQGRITVHSEIINQDDEKVAEYTGIHILRRKT
jgi:acyl dehydratase